MLSVIFSLEIAHCPRKEYLPSFEVCHHLVCRENEMISTLQGPLDRASS
jgi:hypothetical protein